MHLRGRSPRAKYCIGGAAHSGRWSLPHHYSIQQTLLAGAIVNADSLALPTGSSASAVATSFALLITVAQRQSPSNACASASRSIVHAWSCLLHSECLLGADEDQSE